VWYPPGDRIATVFGPARLEGGGDFLERPGAINLKLKR
jgi:hypothetical protein